MSHDRMSHGVPNGEPHRGAGPIRQRLRWRPALGLALGPLWIAGLIAAAAGPSGPEGASRPELRTPLALPPAAAQPADATAVGSDACAVCHQEEYDSFVRSVHGQTESGDWPATGCESCHGPGSRHVEDPGQPGSIFSFDPADHTAEAQVERCQICHDSTARTFSFHQTDHMEAGITCSTCHKPHQAAGRDRLLVDMGPEACLACHQEVRASINLNERHRILEGMVRCVDCHDPHGPSPRTRLAGFDRDRCVSCHTDKQGPFVFEHAAGLVEGCVSCHQPHGSVNRHLLLYQNTAELCYSCHTAVPAFHSRFTATTNCTNCHVEIHGSNLDPFFLH